MPFPNDQPTLPVEAALSETERLFISEEPPNLFPGNQNSNWGLIRKIITDQVEIARGYLDDLHNEMFVETSSGLLPDWETQQGLPVSTNLDDAHRRTAIASRVIQTPFTRTRRKNIVERFINDTFGTPASFSSGGISLSGGIALHSEFGDVSSLYHIVENVENFSYEVQISNSVDPDLVGLERELLWFTPAHISFTITRF